MYAVAVVRRH